MRESRKQPPRVETSQCPFHRACQKTEKSRRMEKDLRKLTPLSPTDQRTSRRKRRQEINRMLPRSQAVPMSPTCQWIKSGISYRPWLIRVRSSSSSPAKMLKPKRRTALTLIQELELPPELMLMQILALEPLQMLMLGLQLALQMLMQIRTLELTELILQKRTMKRRRRMMRRRTTRMLTAMMIRRMVRRILPKASVSEHG